MADSAAASAITWGEFQALIQLAIALNLAFAALSSFLGNHVQKEQILAEEYIKQADFYDEKQIETSFDGQEVNISDIVDNAYALRDDYRAIEARYNNLLYGSIRILFVCLSFSSLIMLIVSSYKFNKKIDIFSQGYTILQFLPLMLIAIYAIFLSTYSLLKIRRKRDNFLTELKAAEEKYRVWLAVERERKKGDANVHTTTPSA